VASSGISVRLARLVLALAYAEEISIGCNPLARPQNSMCMAFTSDEMVPSLYSSLSIQVHRRYTILAAFVLCNTIIEWYKSLIVVNGLESPQRRTRFWLHDSRAEISSPARGWFLSETGRILVTVHQIGYTSEDGQFTSKEAGLRPAVPRIRFHFIQWSHFV
jgi:hypothetical protein